MRLIVIITLISTIIQSLDCYAQFTGNWVKQRVVYINGDELEEGNILKYSYMRYTFNNPTLQITSTYQSKGIPFKYSLKKALLELRNETGFVINTFRVEHATDSVLVLLQKGLNGFAGDDCLRFYFIPERKYQDNYRPGSEDIFSVSGRDTTFIASAKLYPRYLGNKDYFDVLKQGVPEQPSANLHFYATFIVKKNGQADSLKIIESFDEAFDKVIIKNFKKTKNDWQAGLLNGRPVDVQMIQEYRYFSSATALPMFDYGSKGKSAMRLHDYTAALYYFDLALQKMPSDVELLYNRALCKRALGNNDGSCKDLTAIKLLGKEIANDLITKWCK